MLKRLLSFHLVVIAVLATAGMASAQHNDIEFYYDHGMIEFADHDHGGHDHGLIFEGNFPTSGIFARFTTDPGFGSETIEGLGIGPNDIISYNILDHLFFWSPISGNFASPGATTITIDNAVGADTLVGAGTGPIIPGGVVGQADSSGDFHAHVGFELSSGAETGAYGMLMELSTDAPGIANSEPFFIVFNYGLGEPQFEVALEAFEQVIAVPEPSTIVLGLMGAALGAGGAWRRRAQRRSTIC